MLDALTNRTRVTAAALLRAARLGAGANHERRSAAELFPLWSNASCAINILPLKTKIKQRVPRLPSRNCSFKLEITFCVRGVASPLLANVYLHYVFDRWAQAWRRKQARDDMIIVRFADDIVVGFQRKSEAVRFWAELGERMEKIALDCKPKKAGWGNLGRLRAKTGRSAEKGSRRRSTFSALRTSA